LCRAIREIAVEIKPEPVRYSVIVKSGLAGRVGKYISKYNPSLVVVISNPTVMGFHGKLLLDGIQDAGLKSCTVIVPDGEKYKNPEQLNYIYGEMIRAGADRRSMVIPLGGGVIGDMGGFAAATYMRGVGYVHVPTTLLAMVDSSIGGKVGIDLLYGKNLAGAFYQPWMVFTDPSVLATLPDAEFSNGMAEVIKSAVIGSPTLFEMIEKLPIKPGNISKNDLEEIIFLAGKIKADIIQADVYEKNERMKLNLGHTTGHAIEKTANFTGFSHGQAVAVGMVAAVMIAEEMGILEDKSFYVRLEKILNKFNLPVKCPNLSPDKVHEAMNVDKKRMGGMHRFVLPVRVGCVRIVENVNDAMVLGVIRELCKD